MYTCYETARENYYSFSCQIQYYFTHVETNQSGGENLGKTPDTPLSRGLVDPRQGLNVQSSGKHVRLMYTSLNPTFI